MAPGIISLFITRAGVPRIASFCPNSRVLLIMLKISGSVMSAFNFSIFKPTSLANLNIARYDIRPFINISD